MQSNLVRARPPGHTPERATRRMRGRAPLCPLLPLGRNSTQPMIATGPVRD